MYSQEIRIYFAILLVMTNSQEYPVIWILAQKF